jgi:hypothetical protein
MRSRSLPAVVVTFLLTVLIAGAVSLAQVAKSYGASSGSENASTIRRPVTPSLAICFKPLGEITGSAVSSRD